MLCPQLVNQIKNIKNHWRKLTNSVAIYIFLYKYSPGLNKCIRQYVFAIVLTSKKHSSKKNVCAVHFQTVLIFPILYTSFKHTYRHISYLNKHITGIRCDSCDRNVHFASSHQTEKRVRVIKAPTPFLGCIPRQPQRNHHAFWFMKQTVLEAAVETFFAVAAKANTKTCTKHFVINVNK